jgi:dTDP-4-amino-4,6-dideoxygalactose transaminase
VPEPYLVPMSSPDLSAAERDAVLDVLGTPNLSIGPKVQAFEQIVAERVGARHGVAVNSGTAGLHLCVRALGIEDGDRVITTPFSFIASANVLLYERAIPVFVDVDPDAGNIDPDLVAEAAEDLTKGGRAARRWLPRRGVPDSGPLKALLPVDVFGQPADFDALNRTARAHGLCVLEDSCEALGAEYKGLAAGRLGDAGVFGFYPNKQITTGEGGLIVTDDQQVANMARALRNQGRAPGDTWLDHTYLGYNYRLDEMSAALGLVQMRRFEELLARREAVAGWYAERLESVPRVETLPLAPTTTRISWFVYIVRLARGIDRAKTIQALDQSGIPARPYFSPIHLQKFFVDRFGYQPGDFPVAEDLGRRSLALPFSSIMTRDQVSLVCEHLAAALAE